MTHPRLRGRESASGGGSGRSLQRRHAVAGLVALTLAAIMVGGWSRLTLDTSVDTIVPHRSGSLPVLNEVQTAFGGDPVVVVLTARAGQQLLGPDLLPRLLKLEGALAVLPNVAVVYGPATMLNQVAAQAQQLLATISGRRDAIHDTAQQQALARGASKAKAAAAGQNALTGFDRRYGSLLAQGLPAGLPTLRNPTFVHAVAFDGQDRPRAQYKFVIPTADSVVILVRPREALSNEGVDSLVARTRSIVSAAKLPKVDLLISGGPVLAAGLASTIRSELPRLALVATLLVGLLFLIFGTGRRPARMVPLLSALTATGLTLALFGLVGQPVALGMLALLPVLLGVGSDFPVYLARGSSRRTVIVAALASSVSFASLALSPVPFVRGLGVALSLGVLLSLSLGLLLARASAVEDLAAPPRARHGLPHRKTLLAGAVVVAACGWALLPTLSVEGNPNSIAHGVPQLAQAQIAEQTLDTGGEVDVLLRGPDVLSPVALNWQNQALASVVTAHGDDLHLIASPSTLFTFLGSSPTAAEISAGTNLLPSYLLGVVVTSDHTKALTSYGVGLSDLGHQNQVYADITRNLPPLPDGYSAAVTGLPVLAAEGYDALSSARVWPNVLGLAMAALVLLVGLPKRTDMWRAVLSSALAIGWGLVALKLTDTHLTPLTASLGSLTAAVSCEFLVVAVSAQREGQPRRKRGVALAAATSATGYLVLALSTLGVMQSFGIVLAISMGLAYAATALVLQLLPVPRLPATNAPFTLPARTLTSASA
jgi:predicted RND superfamily exporter protein